FFLTLDLDSRFPAAEKVIPVMTGKVTTARLAPEDATFQLRTLTRLPDAEGENAPITVVLNGQVALRAQGEGQPQPTELMLTRSQVVGTPVSFACNRHYLARALQLGFGEWKVQNPEVPMVCRDAHRVYLFMPLPSSSVIAASTNALRVASEGELST